MADLFWLAFSWMRASLLKLDLAFLRPLISFVQRSGFAVEDESRAVDFRLGQCVANWTPLLVFACGLCVTSIKIDPFEHGEVFVLDDGGKVDLDLGNYERFLDVILTGTTTLPLGRYIRLFHTSMPLRLGLNQFLSFLSMEKRALQMLCYRVGWDCG